MSLTLYVGLDDSNHAGKTKGEIDLATFSLLHEDSIVRCFKNTRDYDFAQQWLESKFRTYRFTILFDDKRWGRKDNLVYAAPVLIKHFLLENPAYEIDKLNLYIDGPISSENKNQLREEFSNFPNFVVGNFIKKTRNIKGRVVKRPRCPALVYVADILANRTFQEPFEELLKSKKFVPFPNAS